MAGDHAFPGLSLYLPVPYLLLASSAAQPGDLGVLPCYTCGCVHTACWALTFLGFLPVLCHPTGSSSPCSGGFSSPLWFPTFAMGSPLRGRGFFVLDRNEGLVSPFGSGVMVGFLDGPRTSVWGFSARPVPQGVLPGGPRCGRELRLCLALSQCSSVPCYSYMLASTTLATGLGLSFVPYPRSCRIGFEPLSEATLCALQPLAPSFRVVLAKAAGLRKLLDLSIVLPWP